LLEDDDPDTVGRMLEYLYTLDYDDGSSHDLADGWYLEEQEVDKEDEASSVQTSQPSPEIERAEAETDQAAPVNVGPDDPLRGEVFEGNLAIEEARLLNNVLVYAIAEKYDLPELKELAKTKFLSQASLMSADSLMSSDIFPEVITRVYKSTPSSDRGLRNVMSQIYAKHVRTLMNKEAFKTVVRNIGDFGVDLLYKSLKYDAEQLEQALAEKLVLENELEDCQARALVVERVMNRAQEKLKDAVGVVNRYTSCRHCSEDFSCHFDGSILRCAKCRTRHY
jgi:hypothetical protein